MKPKEFRKLYAYYGAAAAAQKRIERLTSFLRGLEYRLREKPEALLELTVRRTRSGRTWDAGASMKLEAGLIGRLLLPIVKKELAEAKRDFAELPAVEAKFPARRGGA